MSTQPTNLPDRNEHYDELASRLSTYKAFQDYLYLIGSESITEEQLDQLYNKSVTILFNGHFVEIPFDANIYNLLVNLIETMIKEF